MSTMKIALVTGGSRGLGAEIALRLGGMGYGVAVNYLKSDKDAYALTERIGSSAIALKADVSDIKEVEDMAEKAMSRFGRLDVLINNAGITKDALLPKLSEEDWDRVLNVNLKGCMNTVKVFAPLMRDAGGGHIVNISSRSGLMGRAGQAAYSASKAGILGLTLSLAAELGEYNIKVNAVIPGYMPTEMGRGAEKALETAKGESLLGKLADPREAASFISWLIGTEGITGQVFTLDSRPVNHGY